MDTYKDYLEANADYATDLAGMIADFVNYGNAKQRIELLSGKTRTSCEGEVKEREPDLQGQRAAWRPLQARIRSSMDEAGVAGVPECRRCRTEA